jgi:MFS transporter, UMF1 family
VPGVTSRHDRQQHLVRREPLAADRSEVDVSGLGAGRGGPIDDLAASRRERWGWYAYDWANSAYVTTTATVLFAPYLTSVARAASCSGTGGTGCRDGVAVLGLSISPGSLVPFTVTLATILSVFVLPVVGAVADRSDRPRRVLAGFAWLGSAAAAGMWFVQGTAWQLGVVLLVVANLCLGASLVVYDAILVDICPPDERDEVSSRGWALGYLGGFLLLSASLAFFAGRDRLGLSQTEVVRWSLLVAGLWWGGFTVFCYRRLRDRPVARRGDRPAAGGPVIRGAFRQLATTLGQLRGFPHTLRFLLAYLFFNDGIQTVIGISSIYGAEQLGFGTDQLIITILLVQIVAFVGSLLFGLAARRYGARDVVLASLALWTVVVAIGFLLPRGHFTLWLGLAVLIGMVLGGSQALSRSMYSRLVPIGREAEYFSLYQACERGTSWLGTLVFGVVQQVTGSYRPAILALVVFFVVGALVLRTVDVRQGTQDAQRREPAVT